ncbi:MAG: glycosyltransferase family 4 protein [Bacteroidota bacterium]
MGDRKKILVIGQTPPPYGGQAMMTERLLKADMPGLEKFHVRLNFSQSVGDIGKFSFRKITHVFEIVYRALQIRFRHGVKDLYYMPVGNSKVPLIRDLMILACIRWFFPRKIYHFRAAGLSTYLKRLPGVFAGLSKWLYGKPQIAIHLASRNPDDGGYLKAKTIHILPNGLEDAAESYLPIEKPEGPVRILSVGVVKASKGIMVLLEACQKLREAGLNFRCDIVGGFDSPEFEQTVRAFVEAHQLAEFVQFLGVLTGQEKWSVFSRSHIFCFPSYFESESFGNVVLEAMMFDMPVVGSNWRGIPEIIQDGITGMVVPVKDSAATADALAKLIVQDALRVEMGKAGRARFLQHYRLPNFLQRIEAILLERPLASNQAASAQAPHIGIST